MQNRVAQCYILPPIRFLASPAAKHAVRVALELNDSTHRKNAELRF